MSLLSLSCTFALRLGACSAPEPVAVPYAAFATAAVSEAELSAVRGLGEPEAGLDQAPAAARVRSTDISFNGLRTSDQAREFVDNWNVAVAAPLIAQAIADAR